VHVVTLSGSGVLSVQTATDTIPPPADPVLTLTVPAHVLSITPLAHVLTITPPARGLVLKPDSAYDSQ
jgi:hypothetical protein